jgi:uncharacterized membrane protein YphA (DoxX/SURF4 family)
MKALMNWPGHSWIGLAARWYLGYVFIYACIHKIAHPASFALDVATYEILPLSLINLMAIILPWIELVAGILLVVGYKTRAAAWMISGMMVIFIVAVALALAKGLDMSCGCFASQAAQDADPISMLTIWRDTGWLVLSVYVLLFEKRPLGVDRLIANRREARA